MDILDFSVLSRLVPEIALVLIFGFFILKINREYLTSMNAKDSAFLKALADQTETNRQFLASQRTQMNEALGRLADEMKIVSQNLSSLNAIVIAIQASMARAEKSRINKR